MKAKLLGLLLLCALATAAASSAADAPIVATPVAAGTMHATTIHAKSGAMIFESITIAPGGSFGWHAHGAPVAVSVTGGTLTVFDPSVAGCAPFRVSKGQSFVEPADHVHLARNDGKTRVTLYALYMGVGKPSAANVAAERPTGCKG